MEPGDKSTVRGNINSSASRTFRSIEHLNSVYWANVHNVHI